MNQEQSQLLFGRYKIVEKIEDDEATGRKQYIAIDVTAMKAEPKVSLRSKRKTEN